MKPTPLSSFIHSRFSFMCSTIKLLFVGLLISATAALAQDSPGRFEIGGSLNTLRAGDPGGFLPAGGNFGPQLEGDFNFGRHVALDVAYSCYPTIHFLPGTS